MCKVFRKITMTIVLALCFVVSASAADKITINNLINSADDYNSKTIIIEGEAIGEALERGDYAWVNISDGTNAIGLWVTADEAKSIKYYGDYNHVGDTIQVTGTFSRNCTEHGGDVDIHSEEFKITSQGHYVAEKIDSSKIIIAIVLVFLAAILINLYFYIFKKGRRRK